MGQQQQTDEELDKQIEMFKVKKLIKNLEAARGNGTSMISLIIPPGDQISRVNKMLSDEYGTASNIKSRVNRLSVLSAITSTQQRLKLYSKCPKNGLVIYCGTVITEDGKERKVNIDFEPFKPINTSLYLCDNKFHTEDLNDLLMDDEAFGFIVMDGNGCLYGTVQGSNRFKSCASSSLSICPRNTAVEVNPPCDLPACDWKNDKTISARWPKWPPSSL
jgi:peptide chain release factor subunit 1